ncbi:hypothetical protein CC78DRAFT_529177 [Lojkania enalia]|uniref:Uncharacterized protein n=1 Tax=Lojkania enalia TaxID=147567 RepID=A0A9P4NA15_9PLEO|nr:hypothetical protein CC78DRAFT_529177 [Didymosphaeria enalia]
MNTIKSVYYGWGTLILAGGGAYYFAKKQINADRAAKAEADFRKRQRQYELEATLRMQGASPPSNTGIPSSTTAAQKSVSSVLGGSFQETSRREREDKDWGNQTDEASNPSREASTDPAPTRHAPENDSQKAREKSKYEASDVFRSRKGDRFS